MKTVQQIDTDIQNLKNFIELSIMMKNKNKKPSHRKIKKEVDNEVVSVESGKKELD